MINKETVLQELNEISKHISELQNLLEKSDVDDGIFVNFGHILEHLNFAWNARIFSNEDAAKITQEQFETLCNSIPNYNFQFKLLDGLEIRGR